MTTEVDKSAGRVITPPFRMSFPWLLTPQASKTVGVPPKFGLMAVWTPGEWLADEAEKKRWMDLQRIANEASVKKFQKSLKDLPANYKRPFHRGDEKPQYGFTDKMIFTNMTSGTRPGLVRRDGKTKVSENEIISVFYPGCQVRASVNAFGYNKNGGIGVAFGVNNIMFFKDDVRLDNRIEAEEEFAELGVSEPEDSLGLGGTDDMGLGFPV